ncbi:sensor histidine kinase [Christensenellaceae bacterium OttesenSCG-928-M15]|nr:sensor histidine kinase [Christensenellaceae bacterium OttesenSCG-928-M15]
MKHKTKPAHESGDGFSVNAKKQRPVLNTLLYILATVAVFLALTLATGGDAVYIDRAASLEGFDYMAQIAYIGPECFNWYPKALYTPEDFASGAVVQPPRRDDGKAGYYTYRLQLDLKEGEVYGLCGYSATHAQTLWVNGVLLSAVGTPGESAETMTPKTNFYTVYFTAGAGPTEMIIQRSSFVHANTGQLTPVYLGAQPLITQLNNRVVLQTSVMVGCTLMASLFFFGVFLFFKARKHFLWFSISCLLIVVRTVTVDYKLIMVLFPALDWHLALRLEYISTFLFSFFVILCVDSVFEGKLNRRVKRGGLISCAACALIILITPSIFYTRIKVLFQCAVILFTTLVALQLIRLIVRERGERRLEHMLILLGGAAYILSSLVDILLHSTGGRYDNVNFLKVGAMVFVFANTLALALNFQRVEMALFEARKNERELDEANRMLARLNRMKTEFMANISHEMKTPLTVMSANAQLSKTLVHVGADEEEIAQSLDVVRDEASRLARMVNEVLELSSIQESRGAFKKVELRALLMRTADVYQTLLAQNGNTLIRDIPFSLPAVRGDTDMLVQVVVNILANANAHTKDGEISINAELRMENAELEGQVVAVTIRDTGMGVAPELLPHVFDRYHSGHAQGAGLGLSICRMVVERHGGRIWIESEEGKGTVVTFTLPIQN